MTSRDADDVFGDSDDEGTRPNPSTFLDEEAEAEDDGHASQDEEEDENDDGADVEGLIAEDGEGAAATQGSTAKDAEAQSTDSEDFDEDFDTGDLDDDDLAMLKEAGLDIDDHVPALKARQAEAAKPAEETTQAREDEDEGEAVDERLESSPKRPRTDALVTAENKEELEARLFGEEEEEDTPAADGHEKFLDDLQKKHQKAAQEGAKTRDEVDLFDDDADSLDDFLVEEDQESAAKRRKRDAADEAADLDITEDQLTEIIDIFGSTDVLKPVDEFGLEDEDAPVLPTQRSGQAATPQGLTPDSIFSPREAGQSPVSPDAAAGSPDVVKTPMPGSAATFVPETPKPAKGLAEMDAGDGADPDLKEVMYESPEDLELERMDAPERWVQTYMSEKYLLGSSGMRRWTDDEEDAETTWIYMEAFWNSWYDKPQAEDLIKKILHELHAKKLEPQYIMANSMWQYGNFFYEWDMSKIFELDYRWQKVWVLYRRLLAWISRLREQGQEPPEHIVKKVSSEVWQNRDAEQELTDTWDWLCSMHPDSEEAAQEVKKSHDLQKMAAAIQFGLHEKLGIVDSIEGAPLQVFSITPQEFGTNIERGIAVHKPDPARDERAKPPDVCRKHVVANSLLYSPEAVQDVICLYLSRLIAAEPRVRAYVRQQFWEMCAISTKPTRSGRTQAEEASSGFRESYRAFHIVNRPVKTFLPDTNETADKKPDMLWLDVVNLHTKGFIELEYSLILPKDEGRRIEDGYRMALLGFGSDEVGRSRQRLLKHFENLKDPWYRPQAMMEQDGPKWTWVEDIREKLVLIARAQEVVARLKSVKGGQDGSSEAKKVAEALFRVSGIKIKHDEHLFEFLTFDPIYQNLASLYCYTEFAGERETYIVPTEWNDLRKGILLRTLRDELYPLMWREVQSHLSGVVQREVCRLSAQALTKMIDMGPYTLSELDLAAFKARNQDESDDEEVDWKREKEARAAGRSTVLSVVPDITNAVSSDSAVVTIVNEYGEAVVQHALFRTFFKYNPELDDKKKHTDPLVALLGAKQKEHYEIFKNLLKKYRPALIVIPVLDDSATTMAQKFEAMLTNDKSFKEFFKVPPQVLFCDAAVPRLVAYHPRLKEEGVYGDCANPQQRIAISAARFIQDPFAETAQLWHEKPEHNQLFQLSLHRLQHAVPREMLQRALLEPLTSVLSKVGVDVNKIRRVPHLASVLPFASGLGPRKARLFRRCINNVVNSKQRLGEQLAKLLNRPSWEDSDRSPVVVNVLPFCKISPTGPSDTAVQDIDGFDQTRLPEYQKAWLSEMCMQALKMYADAVQDKELLNELDKPEQSPDAPAESPEDDVLSPNSDSIQSPVSLLISDEGVDDEGNLVRTLKTVPAKKKKVQKDWILRAMHRAALAEKTDNSEAFLTALHQGFPDDELKLLVNHSFPEATERDVFKLRELLIPEILGPFKDKRQEFAKLDSVSLFYLVIGETEEKLRNGSLVCATVTEDKEYALDEDGANKFSDKKEVGVQVMPYDIRGSFRKTYDAKTDGRSGFIEGCDVQFDVGETIKGRVVFIKTQEGRRPIINLSVDKDAELWKENFPIKYEDQAFFVPDGSEDWTKIELGRVGEKDKEKKRKRLKEWVDRPRNIRHPNYYSEPHDKMLGIIMRVPLGTAVFRPSKRFDCLVAMLKVRDTSEDQVDPELSYRTFDIIERSKDGIKTHGNSFELSSELIVDGCTYTDFDDIIARHLDPIMDNLRLFQEHKRFGLSVGMETRKHKVEDVLSNFSKKRPTDLHYTFLLHDKFPGHGLMLWALGGRKVRQELIEVMPEGFKLWGNTHARLSSLVEWFKKDGWRVSHKMRASWLADRKERLTHEKENRGEDAICKEPLAGQGFGGYGAVLTGSGGLQTPRGLSTPGGTTGLMTPTNYGFEGAAPTPSGLMTPTRDGNRTPVHGAAPGTVGGMSAPATPGGLSTPYHASAAPATPRQPGTPYHRGGAATPGTPRASMGQSQRRLPSTPADAYRAAGTPAGPPPATPAFSSGMRASGTPGMYRAAGTPAGPPPATPSPGYYGAAAGTPAGPPPATPAMGYRAAGTPAGPPPATPSPGVYRSAGPGTPAAGFGQPGTPAGPPPATPAPGYRAAAGTPAGPPPGTPAMGYRAAGTPAGPPPATPSPGYYGAAAGTPATLPGSYRAAGTPGGPPPATPSPGYYGPAAGTPAGPPPATPGFRAAGTPSGYRAAGTPAGPPPATPSPGFYRGTATPAGPPPATPSPGRLMGPGTPGAGPAPATPGAAFPSQGAKREDKEEKKDAFNELFD